jgi:predicted transposase/invertase (TIGR01784 family)
MDRRSLFYWSLEFSRGLEAGQDYREAPKVITITMVNYEFKAEAPGFHLRFHIREDTSEVLLTDALEIHFIDMVKFRRFREKDIGHKPLHRWLTWLDKDSPAGILEEVIKMDRGIQKAEEKMGFISRDKEALRAYQMRELALSDWNSGLKHAREEGMQEGMVKGIVKGREEGIREGIVKKALEIARNLKGLGVPGEQIAHTTGLSLEDIEQL